MRAVRTRRACWPSSGLARPMSKMMTGWKGQRCIDVETTFKNKVKNKYATVGMGQGVTQKDELIRSRYAGRRAACYTTIYSKTILYMILQQCMYGADLTLSTRCLE